MVAQNAIDDVGKIFLWGHIFVGSKINRLATKWPFLPYFLRFRLAICYSC